MRRIRLGGSLFGGLTQEGASTKRPVLLWDLGFLVRSPVSAFAISYSFQMVISPAEPNFTQLLGMTIVGYSGDGINLPKDGFTVLLPNTSTSKNFPRSTQTQVVGINKVLTGGVFETVGFYIDSTGPQVPKTAHLAARHIEGVRSAFAAPATGLHPGLCNHV